MVSNIVYQADECALDECALHIYIQLPIAYAIVKQFSKFKQ